MQPKYTTKVSCTSCDKKWFKRTSALKSWGGKCMSCSKRGCIPWNKSYRLQRTRKVVLVNCKKCKSCLNRRADQLKMWSGMCPTCLSEERAERRKKRVKSVKKHPCLECQIDVYPDSSRCLSCSLKLRSGENHYKWKTDRATLATRQERNDTAYKEWRRLVWLRDNFKCKIANPDCLGRLEAHHILSWSEHPELRYNINNGITLCHAHHPRKRAEEKRLSPYFQELVSVSSEK